MSTYYVSGDIPVVGGEALTHEVLQGRPWGSGGAGWARFRSCFGNGTHERDGVGGSGQRWAGTGPTVSLPQALTR